MTPSLILASKSPFRAQLLNNAGLTFGTENADIDERAVEAPLYRSGATPEDVAMVLAEAKALAVSEKHPDAIIIGCDQTLSLGDEIFHKPADLEEAGKNLLKLSGKTHQLNSGIVLVKNGETIWRHVAIAYMTMRPLQPEFIGRYLERIGDNALSSVGAYQVEGEGIQLFEKIEGDYFTIIGLPLLPLLQKLREESLIDG
ncbi:Maf-like protein [Paenochrobactrum glaciei]|uniref:7-methyl-GTP pyrophosphatase n=1 Tax=Paenochrobactrum glaciei TaxID=486407 RepID=A0ABP3R1A1_9HYPH